ncbi:MAG: hypothetical protein Q7S58_16295 [Candidatus Binatus sp.]|uniref:hypothetical protein n=1 Tax=Candidatus Binatus sp. TaxID=2811406 RepID=UPI00271C85F8|nr:hypothetical protein [Candidatus Binatus sp.]MDO8433960.1 hypothetical protein [Candidatus Binatus sp.]
MKEYPTQARIRWLKEQINQTIRNLTGAEKESALFVPLFPGLTNRQIEWWKLLDEPARLLVERQLEMVQKKEVQPEENDDALDSILREAGWQSEDDEELVKEVRELLQKANYPDDLDRYFDVLRRHGCAMNVAGTYADNSERWEFSKVSGGREISVTITFSRDSRSLSWRGTLGLVSGEVTTGQSVAQLEAQLAEWA